MNLGGLALHSVDFVSTAIGCVSVRRRSSMCDSQGAASGEVRKSTRTKSLSRRTVFRLKLGVNVCTETTGEILRDVKSNRVLRGGVHAASTLS